LGLLLHPVYGPWFSLRAAIVTSAELPPTAPIADFVPCEGCSAPCAAACPGEAVAVDAFDVAACFQATRIHAACISRCAARHACVIGREHAFAPDVERRFRAAVLAYVPEPHPEPTPGS
jgi:epoxyqueuosine reductase QueG